MTNKVLLRLHGALLLIAAVACRGATPPVSPAPPPPPPPPNAPVVTAGKGDTLPAGTTFTLNATFTDTSSGAAPWSYTVDWGDGTTDASGSKSTISPITGTHTYATMGTHTVGVSVTNNHGATGTDSVRVDATAPVIIAAGDIGDCNRTSDNATGALLDSIAGLVMPLGDIAYLSGTPTEFSTCFDPAWGAAKNRMRPVAGNHDYYTTGAAGYFGYFGQAAGDQTKGYYDFVLGDWLVIVLNTGTEHIADYAAGSTQEQWLRSELASHTQPCTVAMWHHPQFSTVDTRPFVRTETMPLWNALYEYGADLVLNGHDHTYQRFKPMKPDGTADAAFGIRQITVGTGGGEGLYAFDTTAVHPQLEVRNHTTFGVLKLTLKSGGYDWKFLPAPGWGTFTDSGSGTCHGRPA